MDMTLELMEKMLRVTDTDTLDKMYFRLHLLEILSEAKYPMPASEISEIMKIRYPVKHIWERNSTNKVAMSLRLLPKGMIIETSEEVPCTFPDPYDSTKTITKIESRKLYQIGQI